MLHLLIIFLLQHTADTQLLPGAPPPPDLLDVVDPFCVRFIPLPLSLVQPTFFAYTRTQNGSFTLSNVNDAPTLVNQLSNSGFFQKGRQVAFIVHGWFGNYACSGWLQQMKDAILQAEDSTVFIVNWRNGADNPEYGISAATTQTVSTAISAVAGSVFNSSTFQSSKDGLYLYAIGHSLGGQIVGQTGKKAYSGTLQLFDRVTSLDPAGPGFEDCPDDWHVDKTSAKCVDVSHTDATMQGHVAPIIHEGTLKQWGLIDFYPNGGSNQPNCALLTTDLTCSHMAAVYYFILSVGSANACNAIGVCSNVTDPASCGGNTQNMGYYSTCYKGSTPLAGAYYVKVTNIDNPACKIPSFVQCVLDSQLQ